MAAADAPESSPKLIGRKRLLPSLLAGTTEAGTVAPEHAFACATRKETLTIDFSTFEFISGTRRREFTALCRGFPER